MALCPVNSTKVSPPLSVSPFRLLCHPFSPRWTFLHGPPPTHAGAGSPPLFRGWTPFPQAPPMPSHPPPPWGLQPLCLPRHWGCRSITCTHAPPPQLFLQDIRGNFDGVGGVTHLLAHSLAALVHPIPPSPSVMRLASLAFWQASGEGGRGASGLSGLACAPPLLLWCSSGWTISTDLGSHWTTGTPCR